MDAGEAGRAALARGDWEAARDALAAALDQAADDRARAEAQDGLGEAIWWLGGLDEGMRRREEAYAAFRRLGEHRRAARLALWLSAQYLIQQCNAAACAGWMGRAERLVAEAGPCAEQGWVRLVAGHRAEDPAIAAAAAEDARAIARRFADVDLEILALSLLGRARVHLGRVAEGFALLDEAMAAATGGEVRSFAAIGETCCNMVVACERVFDFERAEQWCRVTEEFARRHRFEPLFAFCRNSYAAVLIATGRWDEAEKELRAALRIYETGYAMMRAFPLSRLAELRLAQGRLDEAEELLTDIADHPAAARARARLLLLGGDPARAAAFLDGRIAKMGESLAAVPLLGLLVEARLEEGDLAAGRAAASRLATMASAAQTSALRGVAELAAALIALAASDPSAAGRFETAAELFDGVPLPLEAARARIGHARALSATDRDRAVALARAALTAATELGAARDADAAAGLLRTLGVGGRTGPRLKTELSRREEEVLAELALGLSNLEIGRRLFISPKTVEHHVSRILSKLDLKTRAAAVAWAMRRPGGKPGTK